MRGLAQAHCWALSAVVASALSCSVTAPEAVGRVEDSVVYGDDDRQDLYLVEDDPLRDIASWSTLALLPSSVLTAREDGRFELKSPGLLGELANLCPGEPFAAQSAAASCSGVLVDENLVLTAAHCVRESRQCDDGFWVFDYALSTPSSTPSFGEDDLYRCKSIPLRRRDGAAPGERWDFAFIELDRPVTPPRRPVQLRAKTMVLEASATVIGHPDGLPTKVDAGGKVIDARAAEGDYFRITSDTFGGSSGSGVFDSDGLLAGTLVRGGVDYEYREAEACFVVRRIPTSSELPDAEHASYLGPAVDCLCASGFQSERLCHRELEACPAVISDTSSSTVRFAPTDGAGPGQTCAMFRGSRARDAEPGPLAAVIALLTLRGSRRRSSIALSNRTKLSSESPSRRARSGSCVANRVTNEREGTRT